MFESDPKCSGLREPGAFKPLETVGFFQFYDKYVTNLSPLMAPYLAHLTTLKRLLVDSYTMAEATLMGGKVNEAAWSDTHQGDIQQVLADPGCEAPPYTIYLLCCKCHETQEAGKISTK